MGQWSVCPFLGVGVKHLMNFQMEESWLSYSHTVSSGINHTPGDFVHFHGKGLHHFLLLYVSQISLHLFLSSRHAKGEWHPTLLGGSYFLEETSLVPSK